MSATPRIPVPQHLGDPVPMTLPRLAEKKRLGEPIVMVTAYDFPSAEVAQQAGVDVVLVGDSGAMTVLGYASTVPVSTDEMLMLASAVRRGLKTPLLVGDLPFGSYEASDEQAIATAQRFVKEAGCDAVKLERAARPRDRRRGDPGHGSRRVDAPDRDRAGRLPGAGPNRPACAVGCARCLCPPGGRLLLDRVRGDSGRGVRGRV
jgi:3-methyl-2-oxobutanoate hydroxymethyltransferase